MAGHITSATRKRRDRRASTSQRSPDFSFFICSQWVSRKQDHPALLLWGPWLLSPSQFEAFHIPGPGPLFLQFKAGQFAFPCLFMHHIFFQASPCSPCHSKGSCDGFGSLLINQERLSRLPGLRFRDLLTPVKASGSWIPQSQAAETGCGQCKDYCPAYCSIKNRMDAPGVQLPKNMTVFTAFIPLYIFILFFYGTYWVNLACLFHQNRLPINIQFIFIDMATIVDTMNHQRVFLCLEMILFIISGQDRSLTVLFSLSSFSFTIIFSLAVVILSF